MPAEKPQAIIGLYLNLAEHAILLCADENGRLQALHRTPPGLPLKNGRNGTATVIDDAMPSGTELHQIADNDETHKQLKVRKWLRGFPVFSVTSPFFQSVQIMCELRLDGATKSFGASPARIK